LIAFLVFAAGFASIFDLSRYISAHRISLPDTYADSDLDLQGKRLKGYTLGTDGLLADWYWMRSLQYIGGKIAIKGLDQTNLEDMTSLNPRLLYPLLDNATTLDPKLMAAYSYGATVLPAIDPKQAKEWFGGNPPDLTVIARSRSGHGGTGADYLYTYLRTYYRDESKATGWNNLAFPNVGMPHVLWELQGERKPLFAKHEEHGHTTEVFTGKWEQVTPGSMTPLQYDQAIGDLVGYLQWMGEPAQNTRVRVGVWVLLFLLGLTFVAWRLNAAFWKDVK